MTHSYSISAFCRTFNHRQNNSFMNTTPPSSSSSTSNLHRRRRGGRPFGKAMKKSAAASAASNGNDVFLVNFDDDELMHLQDLLKDMKEEYGLNSDVSAVLVDESNCFLTVDGKETNEKRRTPYPENCRCVLLNGDNTKRLMPELKEAMIDMGFLPSIFGTFTEKNKDKSIANCARASHRGAREVLEVERDRG